MKLANSFTLEFVSLKLLTERVGNAELAIYDFTGVSKVQCNQVNGKTKEFRKFYTLLIFAMF